jgi:hypothetical protein
VEISNGVRYQVNCSTTCIAEDKALPNFQTMRVKTVKRIDCSSFLLGVLVDHRRIKVVIVLTGSETSNMSDLDFNPAFWQAFKVLSFATSDQMAGTVRQNSRGIVLRTAAPTFCSSVYLNTGKSAIS